MSTQTQHQDDHELIIVILAIISILITELIDSFQCLTSLISLSTTQRLDSSATESSPTKHTSTGKVKTQQLSPSTRRPSTTVVQRKVVGTTNQDSQSLPTASSPRSKRSKPSSNTSTSTRSQSSQASASQRRTRTTKSTLTTDTLKSIPKSNHTIADGNNAQSTICIDDQSA